MLGLAIRNLFARKFRAISTALSVFFGVAMVSGTLLINESVNRSFDSLFSEVNAGDRRHRPRARRSVEDPFGQDPSPASRNRVLEDGRRGRGRRGRGGGRRRRSASRSSGDDGERIGPPGGGPPHIALSTVEFERVRGADDRRRRASRRGGTRSRSTRTPPMRRASRSATRSRSPGPRARPITRSSGITQFGSGDTSLGASLAQFTLEEAQRLTGKEGRFDEIDIAAAEGTTPEELAPASQGGGRAEVRRQDRRGDGRGGRGRHHRGLRASSPRRCSSSPASRFSSAVS